MTSTDAIIKLINTALFNASFPKNEFLNIDEEEFFSLSMSHSVANIIELGIRKADISISKEVLEKFQLLSQKALFQYLQQKHELGCLLDALEADKIPHIALKGNRMRDFYPCPELRTSSDIDILFDSSDEKATNLMLQLGYRFQKDGGTTLNFLKPPVIVIELHRYLFDDKLFFEKYFKDIWSRAILVDGKKYEYILSEEDFYVYMIAHLAKHFSRYGSGIRTVLDVYVYNNNCPENFNRKAAEKILKSIGLYEFEQRIINLTEHWFNGNPLNEADIKLTDYISGAGLYGNASITATISFSKSKNLFLNKLKHNVNFVFPNYKIMKGIYPILNKAPILLPACWVARFFKFFTPRRADVMSKQKNYNDINKEKIDYINDIMNDLHLS